MAAHREIQAHPTAGSLATGVEMIFKEFEKIFASEGVTPIETVGARFDAERHEALGLVERDDVEEGTVVEELQKGFLADGRVLRPAKVRISKKKTEENK